MKFSRLKLWLVDFEINPSFVRNFDSFRYQSSLYRFCSIFLSFSTLTRRFWGKILSFGIKKKKDRNRLCEFGKTIYWILFTLKVIRSFEVLILERNVRVDSWKKRIHYGKFDVLLGSSSHLSFLHDWCTARVSFQLCPIRKTEFPTIHETSFVKGASRNSLIKLAWH